MNPETTVKIESIVISAVTRLYDKEAKHGLDYEDLRCLEILSRLKKDNEAPTTGAISPKTTAITPENLIDLLRLVKSPPSE